MMKKSTLYLGISLIIQIGIAKADQLILGTDYAIESGTEKFGTTVTDIDNDDYMVYSSVDFGPPGTAKGIILNYNKPNEDGTLEIRLGSGTDGELVAEINPARVSEGGLVASSAYVGLLKDVNGVHDITLVGKDKNNPTVGTLKDYGGSAHNIQSPLQLCEGDCDNDSHCAEGLRCFQRSGFTTVPGCAGRGKKDFDYCIEEGNVPLKDYGGDAHNTQSPLQLCEGDCDNDSHCADGLKCFQRGGFTAVPGCSGSGLKDFDYCIKPLLGSDGVMNLFSFEISSFSDRAATLARVGASEYSTQKGIRVEAGGAIGEYDNNDFLTYSNINFGDVGTTHGIRIRYAKGKNEDGKVEIRSGGPTGTLLGTFKPSYTEGWDMWMDGYVGIEGVSGIHDLTFVAVDNSDVMNMLWFELTDDRSELFAAVPATEFVTHQGIRSDTQVVESFSTDDYVTYSNLNFGSSGTTKSIRLTYSKQHNGGELEMRLGGNDGTVIGTYAPESTDGWYDYVEYSVPIDLVDGVHDLTFVAKNGNEIMKLKKFELSDVLVFRFSTDYKVDDNDGRDIQCTYDVVKEHYIDQVYNRYYVNSGSSVDDKFFADLGVSDINGAEVAVSKFCGNAQAGTDEISLEDITYDEGSQFIELYYSGHGSWNEQTETVLFPGTTDSPANSLKKTAYSVKDYKPTSEKSVFKMPELPQFDPSICKAHAAQCCWPRDRQANDNNGNCNKEYDVNCIDKDVADNTDLCYNELGKAPYVNGIDANGFSTYDHEGPIHCHGFAWSTETQETTSRFKANALYFVSMYDHMYQRGYVENIPGSPMCGCVEHMPVVSRSDCTQTNVKEDYSFFKGSGTTGFESAIDRIQLTFQSCQGANNQNNDLSAFVQQLVNDGKLTTTEQNIFKERVIGKDKCSSAVTTLLENSGFQKGYVIDDTEWTHVVSESFVDQKHILDYKLVHEMMDAQEVPIIRRVCPSCDESHKDIYYRRLTPMPEGFNLLDTLMNNWVDVDNTLDVDFSLHSTYLDAYYGTGGWTFCNYNEPDIGFPRECGPTERVKNQWNSYVRSGGDANHHAFLIPANPDFVSKIEYPVFPYVLGTDYVLSSGVYKFGTTAVDIDNGDYMVYPSINFGPSGSTKGIIVTYDGGKQDGTLEIRLGMSTDGELIGEMRPAHGGTSTAYVNLLKDVEGVHDITLVGKNKSDMLNLISFELSDFSDLDGTLKDYGDDAHLTNSPLQLCEGDCDEDSQCAGGLKCFHRDGFTTVPGCAGSGKKDMDYCIKKPVLTDDTSLTHSPLQMCEGHCDNDLQCADDLICFQRTDFTSVPGCDGSGKEGFGYCYKPSLKDYGGSAHVDHSPLQLCEGDCDQDSHCAEGLQCFQRGGFTTVPGCDGSGKEHNDYCVKYKPNALKDYGGNPGTSHLPLQKCEGDCDNDSHCANGLKCFHRDGFTPVPGCTGIGKNNYDYCTDADISNYLQDFGSNAHKNHSPLQLCEGDCDNDSHCAEGLKCFQRSGFTPVPGCIGMGKKDYDYCIKM